MKKILVVITAIFCSILIFSLEPPRLGEIERLKESGEFQKSLDFAKKLGNYRQKIGERGEKLPGFSGFPSSGSPIMFVLLIDFPDYPHTIDSNVIKEMIVGEGNINNYPYESLKNFYERSSYGKLNISGDVYGWYKAQNQRDHYTNDAEGLIEEALSYYHNQGVRFDQCDNDGDGEIDYFAVFWTGPDTGWANFWWGWQGYFNDRGYTIDGKRLGDFSWQWEEDNPSTIIHETGHALGLADYYDYDDSVGPRGGMGGLDIMDGVWGDHNAYSKWILGWLNPEVVADLKSLSLQPLSTTPYAVVLSRDFQGESPFSEYFIVQNRYTEGNDSDFPGSGLMILHIDSRLDCDGYTMYDNSYSEHKLVRVMEADGLEEIEKGKWGDAEDFYFKGNNETFTPSSFPHSDFYSGNSSFVNVENISEINETMTADFGLINCSDLSSPQVTSPLDNSLGVGTTPLIEWNPVVNSSGYEIEIHEGINTIFKSGAIPSTQTSFQMPSSKLTLNRVYNLWIKSKGDGETKGSSLWKKSVFSTGCTDEPYFVSKTFFDPPCYSYYGGFSYYPPTSIFVKFGGNDSTETLEYDGSKWTSYSTNPAPPSRYYPAMAYDAINEKILLFGGYNYDTEESYGDTWSYDPKTHLWSELHPQNSPPPDWAFRATTDSKRKVIVMIKPGATYEWDGSNFSNTTSSGPNYYYGNLAYFPDLNKVIYFGGYFDSGKICKNETWSYDGSSWTKLSVDISPDKRCDAVLSYNNRLKKVVLFGGSDEEYNLFYDYWSFDGTNWQEEVYCGTPPSGYYDMLGDYDLIRGRLVLAKASSETSTYELVEQGGSCEITLSPQSSSFSSEGGEGSFEIITEEGCPSSAQSDSVWISITSNSSGVGSYTLTFTVSKNESSQRSGKITVNNKQFVINQEGRVVPPQINSFTTSKNPFKLHLYGSNFQEGLKIYFEIDGNKSEWVNFTRKSDTHIVIKKGKQLKDFLKSGNEVYAIVENPDGGSARIQIYLR